MRPQFSTHIVTTLLAIWCGATACAQSFREPKIPEVPTEPLAVSDDLTQSVHSGGQASNQDGFVPRDGGDSLGLVPVQPRNGQLPGQAVDMLTTPEGSGGRSQRDQRLLNQIREGNFEDAVPGLDPAENGPMTIRQRYPDGKDQLIRQVIQDENGNYVNHGPWRLYNQRRELVARGQFDNGLMDGTWERWHPANSGGMFSKEPFTKFEGPFISTATFSDGKLDGVWIISDRNARKILEVPYRDGKRHGPATWYYPNSQRLRTVNFRNGFLDGPLMEWDEQNRIVRNDEYINGQKVVRVTSFFAPNQLKSETYYLDGKLELGGEDSWWDGEPAEYVNDGIRVQHGPTVAWHANGQRKMAGQYKDDQRVGLFVWWHENGTRALAGRYQDGLKTGTWTWWHKNGMKSIEGEYKRDEPVGQWTWWNAGGEVEYREDFGQGRDSTGDLPDPIDDGVSTDSTDPTTELEMGAPPEGNLPGEREEIRPYPGDDDEDPAVEDGSTAAGNVLEDEPGGADPDPFGNDPNDTNGTGPDDDGGLSTVLW